MHKHLDELTAVQVKAAVDYTRSTLKDYRYRPFANRVLQSYKYRFTPSTLTITAQDNDKFTANISIMDLDSVSFLTIRRKLTKFMHLRAVLPDLTINVKQTWPDLRSEPITVQHNESLSAAQEKELKAFTVLLESEIVATLKEIHDVIRREEEAFYTDEAIKSYITENGFKFAVQDSTVQGMQMHH